jgi:aspartate/tyrosine/aromatic aminotransferase
MWLADLELMSGRIKEMRASLVSKILANGSKHNWDHFISQIGMFAFTGMDKDMINELRAKYHIYMTMDGRISMAGLNTGNVEYVARAFHEVTDGKRF